MSNIGALIIALIPLLNLIWFFAQMPFHITVAMDVTMTDEGLLEINGRFAIDNNSPITFTYDDLCVVQ